MRKKFNPVSKRFFRYQAIALIILLTLAFPTNSIGQRNVTRDAVLEDLSDIVTRTDLGFNDFSGNFGTLNKDGKAFGQQALEAMNAGNSGQTMVALLIGGNAGAPRLEKPASNPGVAGREFLVRVN